MIYIDDDAVKVGGVVLPGILKSIEVKDDAQIEEQDVEGSSTKAKQAQGYEDAKVTIELVLADGPEKTRLEKLKTIQDLFQKAGQTTPVPYDIVSDHTAARRVSRVIFKSLGTKEDNKKQELAVSLEFWSYNTMTIKAKKAGTTGNAAASSYIDPAYQSYLKDSKGKPPKTSSTPAMDTADPGIIKARLMGLPF